MSRESGSRPNRLGIRAMGMGNPRSRGHRKADVMRSKAQRARGYWDCPQPPPPDGSGAS